MNQFKIKNEADLLYKQALIRDLLMNQDLADAKTYNDLINAISKHMGIFFLGALKPIFNKRYPTSGDLPIVDDYNLNSVEVYTDLVVLSEEYMFLANLLSEYFNYRQTEKNRLADKVRYVTGLCSDLSSMVNYDELGCVYFTDTFTNMEKIDDTITSKGMMAHISTNEGVVTLARESSNNISPNGIISLVQGNGEAGNYNIGFIDLDTVMHISDFGSHDDLSSMLDSNPSSWFEYQAINFSDADKKIVKYDYEWGRSNKTNDLLTLRVVVDLKSVNRINWVTVNPYTPPKSSGKVIVHSIKTSVDGIEYSSIYPEKNVLNIELNSLPQTYRNSDSTEDDYIPVKFAGQGVWSFETRDARYIELIFYQSESYDEQIGHTYYKYFISRDGSEIVSIRIPELEATYEAVSGPPGKYSINANEYIEKGIELIDGWRYCIGIRDIGIYNHIFKPKSEIITKLFETPRPIKKVELMVNEKIPPSFLTNINDANKWITYHISLDGYRWYPISPLHRRPAGDETIRTTRNEFPPKAYEINSNSIALTRQSDIYTGYITSDKPPTSIKLKAILSRPDGLNSMTPVIEDYTLKVYLEE